jgi:flagellar basal body P-ring protein FlgI
MAEFGWQWLETAQAVADLRTHQYRIVRLVGDRAINVASSAVDTANWGVLQSRPNAGENATVALLGKTKVVAGGALSAGALFTTDGQGRAVAVASGQVVIGRALEAASAAGQIITAEVFRPLRIGF